MDDIAERRGIAIVGIACRFPGADDRHVFWENLIGGTESIRRLSDAELLRAGVPEKTLKRPDYVKAAPTINDFDQFDAGFFEYSPREARLMDPQQRILLEEAWHALEDAGHHSAAFDGRIGAFMGSGGVVTSYLLAHKALQAGTTGGVEHLANDKDFISTKLSYKLNLTGPSINVQTACSTSMVAVHLACQSILDGECEMALAGASTVRVPQISGYTHRQGDILSPDGACRAYDAEAEGTVFGSGAGVVVLKHVNDAIADRDHIYAVILGSAVNNDGAGKMSYTASSTEGQVRAMAAAFAAADIPPSTVGLVEGHGTGTVVGDPLEVEALRRCFANDPATQKGGCWLGSVKTNIGHLEQSAGVASLIKAALALHHGRIPPSLNFCKPNPRIDFESGPFRVPTEAMDWPAGGHPRRAVVNSLGLGGTNVFAVLEQAPAVAEASGATALPVHALALSARSKAALAQTVDRWRDHLAGLAPGAVAGACYTAAAGRAAQKYRLCVSAPDAAGLATELIKAGRRAEAVPVGRKLAFLFPGQGAQYPGMARAFHAGEPVFRDAFDTVAARLRETSGIDIAGVVFGDGGAAALAQTGVLQPALFAIEWGLASMLGAWGMRPDAVLGHSVGAYAAAAVAGIYSLEDATELIGRRAALMGAQPAGGAMAALFADEEQAAALCRGVVGAGIAAANSPSSTVVSGTKAAVAAIEERAKAEGVAVRRLTVSHAFHSPLMAPVAEPLAQFASQRAASAAAVPFVSDMTGGLLTRVPDGRYLANHVLQPVRFADGLRALAELGCTDFVEVGPGGALRSFASAVLAGEEVERHGVLDASGEDWAVTMATLGKLWERGYPVDLAAIYASRGARRSPAPLYPFQHSRYWLDDAPEQPTGEGEALCGSAVTVPGTARHYQGRYSAARHPWMTDHRVYGHVTLPVAGALIALADSGAEVAGHGIEVRDLTYQRACLFAENEARLVDIEIPGDPAAGASCLASLTGAEWQQHITAGMRIVDDAAAPQADIAALKAHCATPVDVGAFYACLDHLGLNYGPGFRNVRALSVGPGAALGRVSLAPEVDEVEASLHPALLDACLHLFPALSGLYGDFTQPPEGEGVTFLPVTVEGFRVLGPVPGEVWSHCRLRDGERPSDGRYTLDVRVYAADGAPVAMIEGLTVKQLTRTQFVPRKKAPIEDWLYSVEWAARPALPDAAAEAAGRWVVIADRAEDAGLLTDALSAAGEAWDMVDAARITGDRNAALPTGGPVRGVLLAAALSAPPVMSLDPGDLTRETERQFHLSQAVLRLLTEETPEAWGQPRLWIVTRGAQAPLPDRIGGEAIQSVLWGHGRVIALEHPNIWGGLIDIDEQTDGAALVRELLSPDGEDQIAIRGARQFAPRLGRRALDGLDLPVAPAIRADRSYLVTGGLGTLGLKVARWLVAEQGARHLYLVSRRAPGEAQEAEIAALQVLGAVIRVVSADVTDADQVASLIDGIADSGPVLDGVFHCAGLLNDGIMIGMDWDQYHQVTEPKIEGAWALHQATEELGLGHFVLFSSVLSLIGSMGQLNYVSGNAFLDALVAHRRRLGLAATAMNWGPWEDAGLATESGERGRAIWRARGTEFIPADAGMEIMRHTLAHGFDHMAVTVTDWPKFVSQFPDPPRLYDGLTEGRVPGRKAAALDRARVMEQIRTAEPGQRHGLLVEALGQICAADLELDAPPDPDVSLREAGLDSLMSITVINDIEAVFGTRLPARTLLQGPSVAQLAEVVFDALPGLAAAGPANQDAAPRARAGAAGDGKSGSWLVVRRPRPEARMRLFCFPFAGGGSAVFDSWGDAFDPSIEIVAVEPPGRLSRINETPMRTVEAFARALLPQIQAKLDRPFAMLGHCLGGLTLYETVRFLQARKAPTPVHLFVSGARPPSVLHAPGDFEAELEERLRATGAYSPGTPVHQQPDAVFVEIVRSFGITDSLKMLEQAELRDLVLPTVRAEFEMAGKYSYLPETPLPIPITCFRGGRDRYFRPVDARIWRKFTSRKFEIFTRDVGHFAIVEDFDFIRATIEERLLRQCARSA